MIQTPKAIGLFLCDQVIFEGGTEKPIRYRILDCEFSVEGEYLVALCVADVEIAACRVRVYQRGSP